MTSISEALNHSKKQLPTLDAEFLLIHVLKKSRAYLYTYPDTQLTSVEHKLWQDLLDQRQKGVPLAYLTGHQPFWSLDLKVTANTLIPRPETELLVETTLALLDPCKHAKVLDLGTGTGAIALSIANERPNWQIYATDKYPETLAVAQENQQHLSLPNVTFCLSDWFESLPPLLFDAIISNPPYIAPSDTHLPALQYEPQQALISPQNGLADLQHIIQNSHKYLQVGGYLLLEHGWDQQTEIVQYMKKNDWEIVSELKDMQGNDRVIIGKKN